jgi:hypothetical protein
MAPVAARAKELHKENLNEFLNVVSIINKSGKDAIDL